MYEPDLKTQTKKAVKAYTYNLQFFNPYSKTYNY